MRLRPILMTSLAFGLGVLPLVLATGAGSGSQNAIGTGVLGGMIAATVLGIFFVPVFYVVIKRIFKDKPHARCCRAAGGQVMFPLRTLTVVLAATLASACSMIPDYQRPAAPVPASFPQRPQAAAATPADAIAWRDYFADAQLREVIALALANNRDLRIAALNIEQARAQYRIQRADLFPRSAPSAAQTAQRLPGDLSGSGEADVFRQYSATVGLSAYELDFFGRSAASMRRHSNSTSAPRKRAAARRSAWWPKSPASG